jgi:Tfp pilus assembly protein PilF
MDRKAGAAGLLSLRSVMNRVLPVAIGVGLMLWLAFLPGCNFQGSASRRALQQIRPANNTALLVQNAAYLKKSGRLTLALDELEQAHLQDPENLEILDTLTQSYEELGDFDRAEELYEEALSRGGHHPALENNRCYSLYLQGRLGQAEACFRKVLARQPDNKTARNNLGLVLCRQGREAEALAMWRQAFSDAEARQHLGQARAALGKEVPPSLAGPAPAPAERQVAAVSHPAASPAPAEVRPPSSPAPQAMPSPSTPAPAEVRPPSSPTPQAMPSPSTAVAASPLATPAPIGDQIPPGQIASAPTITPALATAPPGQTLAKVASSPPEAAPARAAAVAAAAVPPTEKPVSAAPATAPVKKPKAPVLTVLDLEGTRIEVKNGSGIHNQARETRSRLSLEGFTVAGIGNHLDFCLEDTTIAYRPESAKVAQALAQKFFPGAKLEQGGKLSPGMDIRVSLGRDQLNDQDIAAAPAVIEEGHKQATTPVATLPGYLTAQELNLRIELRNGNGVSGQAREMGGHLALEGFRVVNIANDRDFGLEKTVITYRPEAARVAQVIYKKFFPEANLQEEGTLPPWTDVRVSLGRDLISGHRHLAQGSSGVAIP